MDKVRKDKEGVLNYQCHTTSEHKLHRDIASVKKGEERLSKEVMDEESKKGRFGWCSIQETSSYLPFIVRYRSERYISVRMVETQLLDKFLELLPVDVITCTNIHSFYITESEAKLLNDINIRHSDMAFGREAFTDRELVVKQEDSEEFYRFLSLCHRKLILKNSTSEDRCGFMKVNEDRGVIPYIVKEGVRYAPLFYFEGGTEGLEKKGSLVMGGWDLTYLKFCCKVQGIRKELFEGSNCKMVSVDNVRDHFSAGTVFEDYWPVRGCIEPVCVARIGHVLGSWTQPPDSNIQLSHLNLGDKLRKEGQTDISGAGQIQQVSRKQQQNPLESVYTGGQAVIGRDVTQSQTNNVSMMFHGKLTLIKEFPLDPSRSNEPPYKIQKAMIAGKIVPCVNVRPFIFYDLMMSLPDLLKNYFPNISIERVKEVMDALSIVLYRGNTGHQDLLKTQGMCHQFDPVPLVLVKDIITYRPQMIYMFSNHFEPKRSRMS